MRNIKTTLRASRNTALLLAAASGMVYMTSCSSDVNYPKNDVSESNVSVGNNPSAQAQRITFYGNPGTRAAADFPEVGSMPDMPAGAPEFNTPNEAQQSQDESRKQAYILKGGEGQIELYGETSVYIIGEVTTHNIQGTGTIYVAEGLSLIHISEPTRH